MHPIRSYSPKKQGEDNRGGENMPDDVKCSVSNCEYWAQGNRCAAEAILIEIDEHASNSFDTEFAEDRSLDSNHQDEAPKSSATCCHTFKPKTAQK